MENLREIIEKHITQDMELLSVKIDSSSSFIKVVIDSANDISVDKTAKPVSYTNLTLKTILLV